MREAACGQALNLVLTECAVVPEPSSSPDRPTNPRSAIPAVRTRLSFSQALDSSFVVPVVHNIESVLFINVLEV